MEGIDDIRAAAETLATNDERLKVRLEQAGTEFWSAMYHADEWPAALRERAGGISKRILAQGSVAKTVAGLSREKAEELAEEILYLLVQFETEADRRAR